MARQRFLVITKKGMDPAIPVLDRKECAGARIDEIVSIGTHDNSLVFNIWKNHVLHDSKITPTSNVSIKTGYYRFQRGNLFREQQDLFFFPFANHATIPATGGTSEFHT
ncbi:MAG: hypothetical protein ACTSUE_17170 [Promethearchaeota archaeon]